MNAVERFLQYLNELVRVAGLYRGGHIERDLAKSTMMPFAINLVNVLLDEMTVEDVAEACRRHPDAERVIGYARA
jgi:hypothetical protein